MIVPTRPARSRKVLLVTTALEDTWGETENILFAGDWCLRHTRANVWGQRSYRVVPNIWDDRSRLASDGRALRVLHGRVLLELTRRLNELHGCDCSARYWQIILDPWLATYVAVMWNRWHTLLAAIDACPTGLVAHVRRGASTPPVSYTQWLKGVTESDDVNERLFARALMHMSRAEVELVEVADQKPANTQQSRRSRAGSAIVGIIRVVNRIAIHLHRHDRVVFGPTGAGLWGDAKLSLALWQCPDPTRSATNAATQLHFQPKEWDSRRGTALRIEWPVGFEKFLGESIALDLPATVVEHFGHLREFCASVPLHPIVICSNNQYWSDDGFKVWVAEQSLRGTMFVAAEHGGGLPPTEKCMEFEEAIGDVMVVWTKALNPKQVQLPALKLRAHGRRRYATQLLLIGCDMPRYSYRAQSAPTGGQILECFEMWCEFVDKLDQSPRSMLRFRPYHINYSEIPERFSERIGSVPLCREKRIRRAMRNARLAVCTYPQTTLSEAMASGPTILLFDPSLWETRPESAELLGLMCDVGIAHSDAESASRFVNSHWDKVDHWWNSKPVSAVRARFHSECCLVDKSGITAWSRFLASQVSSAPTVRAKRP